MKNRLGTSVFLNFCSKSKLVFKSLFLKLVLNLKRKKGKRGEERSWDITENRRPGWMSVRTSSGSRNLPPPEHHIYSMGRINPKTLDNRHSCGWKRSSYLWKTRGLSKAYITKGEVFPSLLSHTLGWKSKPKESKDRDHSCIQTHF